MRTALAIALLLSLAPAHAASPDPYDPLALNEQAAAALQAGDRTLALILLERAARLAPGDAAIAANLRALQAPAPEVVPESERRK